MSGNTFGRLFRLTTYGESHGPGLGGVVDGCPAGIPLSEECLQRELDRRRPGQGGPLETSRREPDLVRVLSGLFEGRTTGTPIAFHIPNADQKSGDYSALRDIYRPSHADQAYDLKYGFRDHRGGGRSSGRETVSRVAGGAIAQALLAAYGIYVRAYTLELGGIAAPLTDSGGAENRPFFAPDAGVVCEWDRVARAAREDGDSLGGLVRIEALGVPPGLGEPVFDKLDALLAQAVMSVGAVKGVEIGAGFAVARLRGSQSNDTLLGESYSAVNSGGILGGISVGGTITLTVAVKPIPSIGKQQKALNRAKETVVIAVKGRHDVSAIPRIVPVLKAMTALVLADALLLQKRFLGHVPDSAAFQR